MKTPPVGDELTWQLRWS